MTTQLAPDPSRVPAGAAAASTPFWLAGRAPHAQQTTEIVHWSWLAASDGEVWAKMIDAFNDAHKDKGVQIRMEVVPEEQYVTKVLAAAATGKAPDFGWGTAGKRAQDGQATGSPCRSTTSPRRPASTSPTSASSRSKRRATRNTTTSSSWSRWT